MMLDTCHGNNYVDFSYKCSGQKSTVVIIIINNDHWICQILKQHFWACQALIVPIGRTVQSLANQ